ncbi:MAG: hypothetical protein JWQ83_1157 [Lacunisphaera sp.]|nr:hypothetical protein [Lacunisphaera sp.]
MIEVDVKEFSRNMTGIQSALLSATSRTVRSMAFNAKDRTLDSLNKYVDKPTPFTMRKGAYNASPPKIVGGDMVSEFSIAPLQSAYLGPYIFDGATRKPGDPGSPKNRIWLPTFFKGSKSKFGGLTAGFVKKISLLIARNKKGKGAGKVVHYGFAKLKSHGHAAYGLWKFPGRKSYTTSVPLMRAGKAVMRGGKGVMRKIKHWYSAGEPELMVESRLETHARRSVAVDMVIT